MRLSPIALVGLCLLLISALWGVPQSTSEQSNQIEDATSKLTEAFKDVQTASSEGASNARISGLTSELNTALSYKENAVLLYEEGNVTGSDYYSSLSGNLSSQVSGQARSLESDANRQVFLVQLSAYSIAQLAAVFSALVLIEFHRVRNFIRRRRMLNSPVG